MAVFQILVEQKWVYRKTTNQIQRFQLIPFKNSFVALVA